VVWVWSDQARRHLALLASTAHEPNLHQLPFGSSTRADTSGAHLRTSFLFRSASPGVYYPDRFTLLADSPHCWRSVPTCIAMAKKARQRISYGK
jgi:hypothetical protein